MVSANVMPNTKEIPAQAPAISALFDAEQNSVGVAMRMYTSLFGNAVRVQTEVLRFLSGRLAKDAQMLEQFGACKGPADVAQLQVKLGSDAIADYFAEMQRVMALFERAADENLANVA